MSKFIKFLITVVIIGLLEVFLSAAYKSYMGNYLSHNPFLFVIILVVCSFGLYYSFKFLRAIWLMTAFVGLLITAQSCNYAKSNQQVIVSDDCGMSWKKINAGDAVPKGGINACYMKIVIPNYPMQGESRFVSNLKDRVRANIHIDYDYSITDALAFIKQAKFIGKANVDADDSEAIGDSFEGAENMVIDKRIKDVAKGIFINEDIVELDQTEMESHLLTESNKVLEPLGVHLNFITLTFDLDEQTRQAIDVSTAMKIYESKGISDIGKSVMVQRAGATKVTVENVTKQNEPKEE